MCDTYIRCKELGNKTVMGNQTPEAEATTWRLWDGNCSAPIGVAAGAVQSMFRKGKRVRSPIAKLVYSHRMVNIQKKLILS